MKEQTIKVTAKLTKHGENEIITDSQLMVLNEDENISKAVAMTWGSFHHIISYEIEEVDIFVSTNYCCTKVSRIIKNIDKIK